MATIQLPNGNFSYQATTPGDAIIAGTGDQQITASSGGNILATGAGNDKLNGGGGNDTLFGDSTNPNLYHNLLNGGGGNDFIESHSWFDTINGGPGDDLIFTYAIRTNQVIDGGTGNDTIDIIALTAATLPVYLNFNSTEFTPLIGGIDSGNFFNFETLIATGGTAGDTIIGGAGNDTIAGNDGSGPSAADSLNGGGGDDALSFVGRPTSSGVETIDGGTGTNTLSWTTSASDGAYTAPLVIDAVAGIMSYNGVQFGSIANIQKLNISSSFFGAGFTSPLTVRGGDGGNTLGLFLGSGTTQETITGGAGNDTINAGYGAVGGMVNVSAGGGDDFVTVIGAPASGVIDGGAGNDTLYVGGDLSHLTISGFETYDAPNSNASVLSQSQLAQFSLFKGQGIVDLGINDAGTINLRGRTTTGIRARLSGGDHYVGTAYGDSVRIVYNTTLGVTLEGDAGNDTFSGGAGNDTLYGGGGNDFLDGGAGTNAIYAGDGNDTIRGGTGLNQDWGGSGNNTVVFDNLSKAGTLYADLGARAAYVGGVLTDQFDSIQNITDNRAGNATLVGDGADNVIQGGYGDNTIIGGGGNDTLLGGFGNDIIYGGAGDDVLSGGGFGLNQLWGGGGNNTVTYANVTSAVNVDLRSQNAYIKGALVDQMNSIQNVIGSKFRDVIVGDAGNNRIEGGPGGDILYGMGGANTFVYKGYADSNLAVSGFPVLDGYDEIADFVTGVDKLDFTALHTTSASISIQSNGSDTSVAATTAAGLMVIDVHGPNAVAMSDILF